ncbi:MAG: hypothetical protein HOP29_07875 [Phycisphaerales bacterium]|nr:hypothetical protein [Phycisphaerales bacterium]
MRTPTGAAVIVADGDGFEYAINTGVQLNAVDAADSCFLRWGGDVSSMNRSINVTLNTAKFVLAEFVNRFAPPPAPMLDGHAVRTSANSILMGGGVQTCQNDAAAVVEVDGPAGVVNAPIVNGRFNLNVALSANRTNTLYFTVVTRDGVRGAPATTIITQDGQAPALFVDFPPDGSEVTNDVTDVAGRVSDMLTGFLGLTVTVNGQPAIVDAGIGTNGTFVRSSVPLAMGANAITAVAMDALGNTRQRMVTVTRIAVPANMPQMAAMAGNGQMERIHGVLPDPIAVQVLRADGTPFVDKVVTFTVERSDGQLFGETAVAGGPVGGLMFQTRTDEQGMARAQWQLGSDAGCGNNRVTVTSTGIAGTTFFCASATPGPAAQINVGTGNYQKAEAGGPAALALRAWVNDACNGVSGVPVTFTVTRGGGRINDRTSLTVPTSDTGHASVDFVLGPDAGTNIVEADFPTNPGGPARFVVFGVERMLGRFEGVATRFIGVVHDNSEQPLQGAAITLGVGGQGYFTSTDVNGLFVLDDIQESGPADLFIDGRTANHVGGVNGEDIPAGSFPSLHFEPVIIPRADNALPMTVMMPPLNPNNARLFDNTQDVELTVEGIAGLRMIVKAGSMTRANGTVPSPADPATISLNQVHHDKVPMPMPDGAAPPFAWTLQPGGSTFDPPIEIHYPNMSGLAPGSIAYFLSFNHDTMRFEIVASGSVATDGSIIRTDPGAGLSIAGWGCNCPPYSVTADCVNCTLEVINLGPSDTVLVGDVVSLLGNGEPDPGTMTWTGGGTPASGGGVTFSTQFATPGVKTITAAWDPDDSDEDCEFEYEITVVDAKFKEAPGTAHGFDDHTDAVKPHKSLEKGGQDAIVADLGANTDQVFFVSANENFFTALPETSGAAMETLTLDGVDIGFTELTANVGSAAGDEAAAAQISVYNKVGKTLMIRLINEQNDDVEVAAPGANVGAGSTCITAGGNTFIDSIINDTPIGAGDDVIMGMTVTAGPDGICDTTVNNVDVPGTDVADATVLNYMNTVAYNQAVVEWTITRMPAVTVNFDLNRDGKINVDTAFLANPEMQAVRDAAKDDTFDRNVFLVDGPTDGSYGFAGFNQRYAFVHGDTHISSPPQSMENTIAHEVGHTLGMCHPDSAACISDDDMMNLMHSVATNPMRLRKAQWDQLNP